ncbi:DUF11 domain-containing protein [Variovorax sp. PCZ-1]|uniref:DUF11 domain-containing protein n=1 Tax=Variovorax sp. PCZ-1 TaxID=2835533 RepID=UPI001BCD959A|nr:DUF11 domain-containing protein [Variovorax sp. PCZ-1]MBS7808462.1 DUF11 domain-containing protein [Variovorax sp. PCZ-1]
MLRVNALRQLQAAIAWLLLLCSTAIQAQSNLVANPFFTGTAATATSWTVSVTQYTTFNRALRGTVPAAITAAGGTTAYDSGCIGAGCLTFPVVNATSSAAQQRITTTVGEGHYLVFWTFYSAAATGANIQTDAYWGNTRVYSANPTAGGWSQQIINLGVATTTSNTLTFLMRDDPAFSQVSFAQVYPYPSLKVSKTAVSAVTVTQPYTYTLVVSNSSPAITATNVTIDDIISAGAALGSVSCSATSSGSIIATCPAPLTFPIAAFNLSPASTLTLTVSATVSASTTGTVTNTAALTSTQRSTLTSVLNATHTAAIIAPAALSVTKSNATTTLAAGSTTLYTITASNAGPAWANNALLQDTPSTGLICTNLTCASSGGASCPASLSVSTLTSSGLAIPIFPAGSSVTFSLTCNVTATGL